MVDGDIVCFRNAVSCEKRDKIGGIISLEPVDVAIMRVDVMMRDILSMEDSHLTFLGGENNFRYKVNPEYKANRKDKPKPIHLEACQQYLKDEFGAIVTDGYEADDALGINQTEETVIYTIDKDLLQIPGHHFNFITRVYKEVSVLDGLKSIYKQALVGDTSDNIVGVNKIGPIKASKYLDTLTTEKELYDTVLSLYDSKDRLIKNLTCLWIMRKEHETYIDREWVKDNV